MFRAAADRAARRRGPGTQRLERNLRRVVGPDVRRGRAAPSWCATGCARTRGTGWRRSGCPTCPRREILREFHLERGHLLGEAVAGRHRLRGRAAARRQLGLRRAPGSAPTGWPLTTVAERLKPEGLYQRFVAFRESLGMEIIPIDRRRAGRPWTSWRSGSPGPRRAAAGRPGPVRARRRGRRSSAAAPGCRPARRCWPSAPAHRCSSSRCGTRRTARAGTSPARLPVPAAESGPLDVRVRALTQTIADQLAEGIAEHPTDWHMLQRLWLDDQPRATRRPSACARTGPCGDAEPPGVDAADRHRVPVLVRRARRGAAPRPRPGRDADRARAHGQRARAGRRRRAAAAVSWCRPGGRCRCATTGRWPGCRSARSRPPGYGGG